MRSSRKLREGSIGLLLLAGLGLFGGIILWLRGVGLGRESYTLVVSFPNVAGMQVGGPVRYRGVSVGRIANIIPGTNGVDVELIVAPATLVIPNAVLIEANQGGLIGETWVDINPLQVLPPQIIKTTTPLASDCNTELILCNRERLEGQIGVNFDELIRGSMRFTNLFSDPAFFANLNALVKNSTVATAEITQLSREMNVLTQSVERELGIFSTAALQSASALNAAAGQIGNTANQVGAISTQLGRTVNQYGAIAGDIRAATNQIGATANRYGAIAGEIRTATNQITAISNRYGAIAGDLQRTVNQIGAAAEEYRGVAGTFGASADRISLTLDRVGGTVEGLGGTAGELNLTATDLRTLIGSVNELVATNRGTLVTTLNNINTTSEQLRISAQQITPLVAGVQQQLNQFEDSQLLANLDTLSVTANQLAANASVAANNLSQLTDTAISPANLLLLQQTLDSARATFQNVQKITSDLEELTGDPALFESIRNILLILGDLLSSTEQLEEHARFAMALAPLSHTVSDPSLQSQLLPPASDEQQRPEQLDPAVPPRSASPGPNPDKLTARNR
ncbi:MlaD family protein [Laspinema olomoucense]|uniref:MlaD family protein n=1 Tax=Laspinema olomoucense TaxID=3231600 RepID=UPI0021BACDBB|nr:MlaD family protein [Laspinema sp. D3a]MCT7988022.1 MlaD family protein [Laspinema sp. D3a]